MRGNFKEGEKGMCENFKEGEKVYFWKNWKLGKFGKFGKFVEK